jgi:very-short-patch-repair endonuclease
MVTRPQLLNAGVRANTIDHWVKTGRLLRIHQGVYALGHVPPSPHARLMAAVLACGPRAVVSHRSAAHLWGLIRYWGPIEITTPTAHRRTGLIVHRSSLTAAETTRQYGVPTTAPARTLADLQGVLDPASLTRAVNDARLAKLLSLDDLPPGLRRDQPQRPTRSAFEDAFRSFCTRHRLPQPQINAIVAGYEVDAYWPAGNLIAELDGYDTHINTFEEDRAKDADLVEAGHRVVRVTWDRLTCQPLREAARFRRLLGATVRARQP